MSGSLRLTCYSANGGAATWEVTSNGSFALPSACTGSINPPPSVSIAYDPTLGSGSPDGQSCSIVSNPNSLLTTVTCTVTGVSVASANQGQWRYVHSGQAVWLGAVTSRQLTQIDANLMSELSIGKTYYLVRAGISNVSVTGSMSTLAATAGALRHAPRALGGVAGINVVLQNVVDSSTSQSVTTGADGTFNATLPSGTYSLVATDPSNSSNTVSTQVVVQNTGIDVGAYTLASTSLYNFKAEISDVNASMPGSSPVDLDWLYFGSLPGQTPITYSKYIVVTNIGGADVSGASFVVTTSDLDVSSLAVTNTLGGMAAGGRLSIPVTFTLNRPAADKTVSFDIVITDISNRKWYNRTSIPLSSRVPVKVYVTAKPGALLASSVNGYVVTPGRTLQKITAGGGMSSAVRLPYIAGDVYEFMVANPDIGSETAYSVGFGAYAPTDFSTFTNTSIHEPNNDFAHATTLTLGQTDMAYVHVGDIDYYKLQFDAADLPLDPQRVGVLATASSMSASKVAVGGGYAYLIENGNLRVVDISDPLTPSVVGTLAGVADYSPIALGANFAYVYGNDGKLWSVDVSNPSAPVKSGSVALEYPNAFQTAANLVFAQVGLNTGGALRIVDVSNAALPAIAGSVTGLTASARPFHVGGGYVYITDPSSNTLRIVNVADPAAPVVTTMTIPIPSGASSLALYDLAVNGTYAYLGTSSGLQVLNITNPGSPTIGTLSLSASLSLVSGGLAATPTVIGNHVVTGGGANMAQVWAYDISNPANPVFVEPLSLPLASSGFNGSALAASGSHLYVRTSSSLEVIRLK
ncbi:MAG: hypothetical protein OEW21_15015 [Betaproteobacteria bacterium]|nr:hypothetical protein [Betaproteobacteria bacterium]